MTSLPGFLESFVVSTLPTSPMIAALISTVRAPARFANSVQPSLSASDMPAELLTAMPLRGAWLTLPAVSSSP